MLKLQNLIKQVLSDKAMGMLDYYRLSSLDDRFGGPFNGQTIRQKIFIKLTESIRFSAIVETGTCYGTTTDYMQRLTRLRVYTVEMSPRPYGYAKIRFMFNARVKVYLGDSRCFLKRLVEEEVIHNKQVFFYLDAHWDSDLPLKEEVNTIFENWPDSVVMIDDFCVPGDNGYGYDNYGDGQSLNIKYLSDNIDIGLAAFFPTIKSNDETGARRGCVILAKNQALILALSKMDLLIKHGLEGKDPEQDC